jgi:hypothetical protein
MTLNAKTMVFLSNERRRFATWASIDGVASDGRKIASSYVVITNVRWRTGSPRASRIFLEAEASRLTIEWLPTPRSRVGLRATYVTVGMRGFGTTYLKTRAGAVQVAGPSHIVDFDAVNGQLDIVSTAKSGDTARWLERCDDTAQRILSMLSFAEGKQIGWSIRHLVRATDDRIIMTELYGPKPTGKPYDGVGHVLDLQRWVDLSSRYTKARLARTGIDVALYWFLLHPASVELQLLAAITALEHLAARYASTHRKSSRSMDPRPFARIRDRVDPMFVRAIHSAESAGRKDVASRIAFVRSNVRGANRASLKDRLAAMCRAYGVPLVGLDRHISHAIAARNKVVHSGVYREPEGRRGLFRHVSVLRELLKRVFLAVLGYVGPYYSMLNRWEAVAFPPTDTVVELQDEREAAS